MQTNNLATQNTNLRHTDPVTHGIFAEKLAIALIPFPSIRPWVRVHYDCDRCGDVGTGHVRTASEEAMVNRVTGRTNPVSTLCDSCVQELSEIHVGHFTHITGTWFCDTCNSPYCEKI
jgi:hypothetical protein